MTSEQIRRAIEEALAPGHFFLAEGRSLRMEHRSSELAIWEIFRGHLLSASQTRQRKEFESWNLWLQPPLTTETEPTLSIKVSWADGLLFVTRSILIHAHEAYEAEDRTILTRPVQRSVEELVGQIDLKLPLNMERLSSVLRDTLFRAIVGSSRLPITSVESPLPAYSLGQLAYFPGIQPSNNEPLIGAVALIQRGLASIAAPTECPIDRSQLERAKLLETVLRTIASPTAQANDEAPASRHTMLSVATEFLAVWQGGGLTVADLFGVLRTLFNQMALSPYTGFADRLLQFIDELLQMRFVSAGESLDLFGYFLRHLARHLTAFDLVTFHNRGANFPDALFLDGLLRAYLALAEQAPESVDDMPGDSEAERRRKRLRRLGLLRGSMFRKQFELLAVPDEPTSPGENLRVLPAPFAQVPEKQLTDVHERSRRLFENDPTDELFTATTRRLLEQSIADLEQPTAQRELGMAVFLDRPLGTLKRPAEMDRTPLLSYEAFSSEIARQRWELLQEWGWLQRDIAMSPASLEADRGVSASDLPGRERPGVVSLEDARRVASDFRFLRTTTSSLQTLYNQYDLEPLCQRFPKTAAWLLAASDVLLIRSASKVEGAVTLVGYDRSMQPRIELSFGPPQSGRLTYVPFGTVEYLADGMTVSRLWEMDEHSGAWVAVSLTNEPLVIPPRIPSEPT